MEKESDKQLITKYRDRRNVVDLLPLYQRCNKLLLWYANKLATDLFVDNPHQDVDDYLSELKFDLFKMIDSGFHIDQWDDMFDISKNLFYTYLRVKHSYIRKCEARRERGFFISSLYDLVSSESTGTSEDYISDGKLFELGLFVSDDTDRICMRVILEKVRAQLSPLEGSVFDLLYIGLRPPAIATELGFSRAYISQIVKKRIAVKILKYFEEAGVQYE